MLYQSTRGNGIRITASEAILRGLSEDGGLFVPESLPALSERVIEELAKKPYSRRAAHIMGLFLSEFSEEELIAISDESYRAPAFRDPAIAPLHRLDGGTYFLELWHGPTCAFKDMALQVMPRLLTASQRLAQITTSRTKDASIKRDIESSSTSYKPLATGQFRSAERIRDVCILVATSGDTGKAALEGFRDVPGTKIMVFYPRDGVSDVQKLQMTSQCGENVSVFAVEGNFDDAQTGVKAVFSDEALRQELGGRGIFLSSANSINWGRLVPQVAYYFSAYCDLLDGRAISLGDKINFCVPTGNFGNILAAYYAERMGLPVNRLICASNCNDVLTQFLETGVYNKDRPFFTTSSPSMDILVSNNLERLLFEASGKDGGAVSALMGALASTGRYEAPQGILAETRRIFYGGRCSEADTMRTIAETFRSHGYLIDTHTAVAYKVLSDYRTDTGDDKPTVVVSTASPFKFCDSVLGALGWKGQGDGVELIEALAKATGIEPPPPIASLRGAQPRFTDSIKISDMKEAVMKFLVY